MPQQREFDSLTLGGFARLRERDRHDLDVLGQLQIARRDRASFGHHDGSPHAVDQPSRTLPGQP